MTEEPWVLLRVTKVPDIYTTLPLRSWEHNIVMRMRWEEVARCDSESEAWALFKLSGGYDVWTGTTKWGMA